MAFTIGGNPLSGSTMSFTIKQLLSGTDLEVLLLRDTTHEFQQVARQYRRRWLIWGVAIVTLMILVSPAAQEKRDTERQRSTPKAAAASKAFSTA